MPSRTTRAVPAHAFEVVQAIGVRMPEVDAVTRYDGSPVLKMRGVFLAGLASHPSAEPDTLVVRADIEEREQMIADAPETYYLTDYYRPYPLILVRLSRATTEALRDLLAGSWRLAAAKTQTRRSPQVSGRMG